MVWFNYQNDIMRWLAWLLSGAQRFQTTWQDTITYGMRGRLYHAHCMNVRRTDTWLLLRDLNHCLEWVPKDYSEITLFRQWKEQALPGDDHRYVPAEEEPYSLLRFYDTYTQDYIIRIY